MQESVPDGILHPLPNGHTDMSWGSLFKGSDTSDVKAFSDSTTPDADGAVVVNCNDFVGAITLTAKLRLHARSGFAHLVSHLVLMGNSLFIFMLVIPQGFLQSSLLYGSPISLEFYGQNHVTPKHKLRRCCT